MKWKKSLFYRKSMLLNLNVNEEVKSICKSKGDSKHLTMQLLVPSQVFPKISGTQSLAVVSGKTYM